VRRRQLPAADTVTLDLFKFEIVSFILGFSCGCLVGLVVLLVVTRRK
jgi:hypothetical protein